MKNAFGSLSDEDVRQIALLVETLDRSGFGFLQLTVADMTLTLSKGTPSPAQMTAIYPPGVAPTAPVPTPTAMTTPAPAVARAPSVPTATPPSALAAAAAPLSGARGPVPGKTAPPEAGTLDIKAPLGGLFYSRPDPASPPFVTLGGTVSESSTVGLIEIMKVFNAVSAGVAGVITEVCAQDAQMVEIGQTLFRVRPAGSAA